MKACRRDPRAADDRTHRFYTEFGDFVSTCARHRTRGTHLDPDDMAQETMLKLLTFVTAGRFDGESAGNIRGFVRKTTFSVVIDNLRRPHYRAMRQSEHEDAVLDRLDTGAVDPERHARARRALQSIETALESGSERDRQTFDVLFVKGCNARQGADLLGIKHGAMRMRKLGLVSRLREACPGGAII